MNYRAEIDGLRAFAVIPVILYHAGFGVFSGGFVGVDVFFVISGYLITSVLLSEMDEGKFSLIRFYERRARRILPVLFLVMVVCIPFAWILLTPHDLKDFAQSLVAVSTFSSNFLFWSKSGYFETAAELKPLLHTWSLAVEEQYYILFPIILMFSWRLGKYWIVGLLALAFLISLGIGHWAAYSHPDAAFYLLPTRGWEILMGAFAAFYFSLKDYPAVRGSLGNILSVLGLALIVCAIFSFNDATPVPSLYSLVPTFGTLLIIFFANEGTLVNRVLKNDVLVGMGLISYSAYLWHQPLFAFAKYRNVTEISWPIMVALCVLIIPLSYLSWRYVELPFRRSKEFDRGVLFTSMGTFATFLIAIGALGQFKDGFEQYFVENRLNPKQAQLYMLVKLHTDYNPQEYMVDNRECKFWAKTVDANFVSRFEVCAAEKGKAIVILGDSHAMNVYNAFAKSGVGEFVVGVTQGGCRPQENKARCQYDSFDEFMRSYSEKVDYIVFHQSGSYYVADRNGKVDSSLAFEGDGYKINEEYIARTFSYLTKLAATSKVVWLGPFVEARERFLDAILSQRGLKVNSNSMAIFSELEELLSQYVLKNNKRSNLQFIRFSDVHVWSEEEVVGDCFVFRDVDHLSRCGEDILSGSIADYFGRLKSGDGNFLALSESGAQSMLTTGSIVKISQKAH